MFNFEFNYKDNKKEFYTSKDLKVFKIDSNKYGIIISFDVNPFGEKEIISIKINDREYKMPIFLIKKNDFYILIIMKSEFKI